MASSEEKEAPHYTQEKPEPPSDNEEKKQDLSAAFVNPQNWLDAYKYIVSIDFGSFGYAAAFCVPFSPAKRNAQNAENLDRGIYAIKDWGGMANKADLYKNLACLLVKKPDPNDPQSKPIVEYFGYDAVEKYAELQEENKADNYMYFEHFKPYLYSSGDDLLNKDKMVPSVDGQSHLPLKLLIQWSLQKIKEHCLTYINDLRTLSSQALVRETDLFWTITVPAIWDEMSMVTMRQCAAGAGLSHIEMGKEPIVAAFYCMNHPTEEVRFNPGTRVIVLDCGGGTTDAACIEVLENNEISEMHHGDGRMVGGLDVDKRFKGVLSDMFGKELIDEIRTNSPSQWITQCENFTNSRYTVKTHEPTWNIPLCNALLKKIVKKSKKRYYQNKVKDFTLDFDAPQYLDDGKEQEDEQIQPTSQFRFSSTNIRTSQTAWRYFHDKVVTTIVDFVETLLSDPNVRGCNDIILVGGFSNSPFLKKQLKAKFTTKKFYCAQNPHLVVVKGALHWIQSCVRAPQEKRAEDLTQSLGSDAVPPPLVNPLIRWYRSRLTYGISIEKAWQRGDPDERKVFDPTFGGNYKIENSFSILLQKGQQYRDGEEKEFRYKIPRNAASVSIMIYGSSEKWPVYTDEPNCKAIIPFKFPVENPTEEARALTVKLVCKPNGLRLCCVDEQVGTRREFEVDTGLAERTHANVADAQPQ